MKSGKSLICLDSETGLSSFSNVQDIKACNKKYFNLNIKKQIVKKSAP
jgi:hypothetical protein